MIIFVIIMFLLWIVITYTHPWIDKYTDYRGEKHLVLWYTNLKAERTYIDLIGIRK